MKDQINASKILHSSAIYIQSMKITRSLCKKLLMIKSVKGFFLHLVPTFCMYINVSLYLHITCGILHLNPLKTSPQYTPTLLKSFSLGRYYYHDYVEISLKIIWSAHLVSQRSLKYRWMWVEMKRAWGSLYCYPPSYALHFCNKIYIKTVFTREQKWAIWIIIRTMQFELSF